MPQGEFSFSDSSRPAGSRHHKAEPSRTTRKTTPTEDKTTKIADKTTKTVDKTTEIKKIPSIYSVTQLVRLIKLTLNEHVPETMTVSGEISNFKRHSSGHLYLTLKDETAQLSAVMWRSRAETLPFKPTDGLAVVATGRIDIYEPQGKFQFYIDTLQPEGMGALELAFRQLAERLRQEGLFDEAHKKPIPAFPETIAIVTSASGAAIEDIVNTLNRRFPIVRKLLYPVAVQGEGAAEKIAHAIRELNRRQKEYDGIDVILVGRGGGNIEDLWAFNEEIVARAIFHSQIPIISGIGHEVDTTIADFVADRHAATPTAAAEIAVPVLAELCETLSHDQQRLQYALSRGRDAADRTLRNLTQRPFFARPLDPVRFRQQGLDEQSATLSQLVTERLRHSERDLENCTAVLRHIEPHYALKQAHHRLLEQQHRLHLTLGQFYQRQTHRLEHQWVRWHGACPRRRMEHNRVLLAHLMQRTAKVWQEDMQRRLQRLNHWHARLGNLNPRSVLARGYSITRSVSTHHIVKADSKLRPGDLLTTELGDSTFMESQVTTPPTKRKDRHG